MKWNIACYVRLSREDGDLIESDSVTNQRKLLANYVEQHFELDEYKFYVDENVTGTKFDRKQFNKLLNDIKKKEINCIIVKDLSRFGRNYIDAGMFLEDFFPRHNVRFISILDGLDTYSDTDDTTSLMVRIKNLMHDNNSREISKKVRASHTLMRKQGKHIARTIYGYKKNPEDKYSLIVDRQVAHVVQWIFNWYANGMGMIRIAQKLNSMGIACCSEYRDSGNLRSSDDSKAWNPSTIIKMLRNHTYIGSVHQGMTTTRNYKDRKTINLDVNDHIIIENMHDAIIEKQLFNHVQYLLKSDLKTRTPKHRNKVYLFSGYLRCKECGNSMLRCPSRKNGKEYVYYRCRLYKLNKKCNHSSSIKHEQVFRDASKHVMDHIRYCVNLRLQLNEVHKYIRKSASLSRLENKIKKAQAAIAFQKNLKCYAYEDWKMDNISKDDFLTLKSEIDRRIQSKADDIERSNHEVAYYASFNNNKIDWLDNIVQYKDALKLNRKIVTALIHKIFIDQDQLITVVFNNSEEIERLKEYINAIQIKQN